MKILIAAIGTRGDVQPYIALGRELNASGHDVSICTCLHFQPFVRENGLEYAYVNNDFIDFMHTPEGKIILGNAGNAWQTISTVISLLPKLGELQDRQMADIWAAARDCAPDLILYHPKALGTPDFAEKLGIPCMLAFWLLMYVPTARFPAMGFPDLPLGNGYRRLSYHFIRRILVMMSKRVRKWRSRNGLPPRSPGLRMQLPDGRPIPALHGYSRHVIARPDDWSESATVTGYWFLDQTGQWEPPQDLTQFLSKGEPPVYFGFGSIFGQNPGQTTRIVLEAVRRSGVRAILAKGWGGLIPEELSPSDSVMTIESAPHSWLFPRVQAVVHHGGCGTTAAGLLAGRPSIICPFFGDQPFWGHQIFRLKAGPPPIPQKKLTADRLCRAIDRVINDPVMRENAGELGRRIQEENGVSHAVSFIEQWMKNNTN